MDQFQVQPNIEDFLSEEEDPLYIFQLAQDCIPDYLSAPREKDLSNDIAVKDTEDATILYPDDVKVRTLSCNYTFTWQSTKPLYELCQCFKNSTYHQVNNMLTIKIFEDDYNTDTTVTAVEISEKKKSDNFNDNDRNHGGVGFVGVRVRKKLGTVVLQENRRNNRNSNRIYNNVEKEGTYSNPSLYPNPGKVMGAPSYHDGLKAIKLVLETLKCNDWYAKIVDIPTAHRVIYAKLPFDIDLWKWNSEQKGGELTRVGEHLSYISIKDESRRKTKTTVFQNGCFVMYNITNRQNFQKVIKENIDMLYKYKTKLK